MKSNVDVKIIDNNIDDLYKILNTIDHGLNIIYSNCTFDIKIGYETIKERKFDSFLYNEESDLLLLLPKDNNEVKNKIINYLELKNKLVSEVTFLPLKNNSSYNTRTPNISVCRDKNTLEEIILDNVKKGINYCEFYPELLSYFMLGYRTNHNHHKKEIDGRCFKGFIKLDTKYILLVNQIYNIDDYGNTRNLDQITVEQILKKYKVNYDVFYSNKIDETKEKRLYKA